MHCSNSRIRLQLSALSVKLNTVHSGEIIVAVLDDQLDHDVRGWRLHF